MLVLHISYTILVGLVLYPKMYIYVELQNVALFGIRVFADVINIKILKWDHLGLEWALNILYVCIYVIYVYITYIYTYK